MENIGNTPINVEFQYLKIFAHDSLFREYTKENFPLVILNIKEKMPIGLAKISLCPQGGSMACPYIEKLGLTGHLLISYHNVNDTVTQTIDRTFEIHSSDSDPLRVSYTKFSDKASL